MDKHITKMEANKFELEFDKICTSDAKTEDGSTRVLRELSELADLRRDCKVVQKELTSREIELKKLRDKNKLLRSELVKTLIEKEELLGRREALVLNIEKLRVDLEAQERDNVLATVEDEARRICNKFALQNQQELMQKFEEAKQKLDKLGIPHQYVK